MLLAAVASTLSAGAATLDGEEEMPDLGGLDAASDRAADALASDIARRPPGEDDEPMVAAVERSFRVSELAVAAREIGANTVRAAGLEPRQLDADTARSAIDASRTVARGYGSLRAVLLRNAVRGAAALAVAVFIARQSSLQHSFWIVLGTLSVLRSNALGTEASVVSALRGTAVGLLVGVGLVLAVGTNEVLLWCLLPPAVLLAAYAPQAISFAAGQAGFTITLLILFNLIQPTGWSVDLIRLEDVTIGFAVSLVVGALFWPRGAAALMRRSLATSYARSADYLAAAVQHLIRGSDGSLARRRARAAADRLDDVFRQFLGELSRPNETGGACGPPRGRYAAAPGGGLAVEPRRRLPRGRALRRRSRHGGAPGAFLVHGARRGPRRGAGSAAAGRRRSRAPRPCAEPCSGDRRRRPRIGRLGRSRAAVGGRAPRHPRGRSSCSVSGRRESWPARRPTA